MNKLKKYSLKQLENRLLLDGAAAQEFIETTEAQADNQESENQTSENDLEALVGDFTENSHQDSVIFLDQNISGFQFLLSELSQDHEVIIIEDGGNGLQQISDALENYSHLKSIHIFSHGDVGQIQLAGEIINENSLASHETLISEWSNALTEDADIFLYGCNIGQNGAGLSFMQSFAILTEADIAASSDLTGDSDLGGDWDLEAYTGPIEAETVVTQNIIENYNYTLMFDSTGDILAEGSPTTVTKGVAALGNGNHVVVWVGTDSDGAGIIGKIFDETGAVIVNDFVINSNQTGDQTFGFVNTANVVTAISATEFVVVWADENGNLEGRQLNNDGTASSVRGSDFVIDTGPNLIFNSMNVASLDTNEFLVTWADGDNASTNGTVSGRVYSTTTNTSGSEFFVKAAGSDTAGTLTEVAAEGLNGGGFVVTWNMEDGTSGDYHTYARLYNASNSPVGSAFQISQSAGTIAGGAVDVDVLVSGNIVFVWDHITGLNDINVNARIYNSSGTALGSEFTVNSTTTGRQEAGDVEALTDGSFVIVFDGQNYDADEDAIVQQLYTAAGATDGSNTILNATTAEFQYFPSVDARPDGGYVVIWSSGPFTGPVEMRQTIFTPGNQAPILDNSGDPILTAIDEDDVTNSGDSVLTILGTGASGDPITDPDADPEGIAVTQIDNTFGFWQFSTNGGTSWSNFSGSTGIVNLSAARLLASDNPDNRIRFVPNLNYNGADPDFTFRAWDQTQGSDGGTFTITSTGGSTAFSDDVENVTITVNPVNDAPVPTAATTTLASVPEETANPPGATTTTLFAGLFSDIDVGDVFSGVAIIGNAANALTEGVWQFSTNSGGTWTNISAAVSDTNALVLDTDDLIRFVPVADFDGDPGDLTTRIWDGTSGSTGTGQDISSNIGGIGAFSSASVLLETTITNINDAPSTPVTSVTLADIDEDNFTPPGETVDNLFAANFVDPDGGAVFSGVAIVGNAANSLTEGNWEFSINGGTTWAALSTTVSDSNATVLAPTALLRFVPVADYNGDPGDLTTRVWDGTSGSIGTGQDISGLIGGSGSFSADTDLLETTVNPVNDAPIPTGPTATLPSVPEETANPPGATTTTLFAGLFSDIDVGDVFSGVAIVANAANALTEGVWQFSTNGGGSWTNISTALTDSNALVLDTDDLIRFLPAADFSGAPGDLTARQWDGTSGSTGTGQDISSNIGGIGAFSSGTMALQTNISSVNDAPSTPAVTTVSLAAVDEDTANPPGETVDNLTAANFFDPDGDAFAGIAIVGNAANTATQGFWQFSTNGGASWSVISTTVSDTNAIVLAPTALIRFLPASNFNGDPGDLTTRVWDGTSGSTGTGQDISGSIGGTGSFSADTDLLETSVNPVNDAPAPTTGLRSLPNVPEDETDPTGATTNSLYGSFFFDIDVGDTFNGLAIISNAANSVTEGVYQFSTDGGTSWTDISSTVSDSNALVLDINDQIRFLPVANYNGTPGLLGLRVWDGTSGSTGIGQDISSNIGGTGAFSLGTASIDVTVVADNDAPTVVIPNVDLPNIDEDASDPAGDTVNNLFLASYNDIDADPFSGIAIVGNSSNIGEGVWQYSTNAGFSWATIGATISNTDAIILDTNDLLRFLPAPDYNGTPGILTTRVWDGTSGSTGIGQDISSLIGGSGSFSNGTALLNIVVDPVNDAPVPSGPTTDLAAIDEDDPNPPGETVENLFSSLFTDVDAGALFSGVALTGNSANLFDGSWQFSNDNGTSWTNVSTTISAFNAVVLDPNALIRFLPSANFNGVGSLVGILWDGTSGSTGVGLDISTNIGGTGAFSNGGVALNTIVNPVNDAPELVGGTQTVNGANDITTDLGITVASFMASLFTDIDLGDLFSGAAIIGNTEDGTLGTYQYQIGSGPWIDVPNTVGNTAAVVLANTDLIRFQSAFGATGTVGNLFLRTWDGTSGSVGGSENLLGNIGGTGAFSNDSNLAILEVEDVFDERDKLDLVLHDNLYDKKPYALNLSQSIADRFIISPNILMFNIFSPKDSAPLFNALRQTTQNGLSERSIQLDSLSSSDLNKNRIHTGEDDYRKPSTPSAVDFISMYKNPGDLEKVNHQVAQNEQAPESDQAQENEDKYAAQGFQHKLLQDAKKWSVTGLISLMTKE